MRAMAAVFIFVFFFGVAATSLLIKLGSATVGGVFVLLTFLLMAAAIFINCYKLAKEWEGPETR